MAYEIKCPYCGKQVESARVEAGLTICYSCAERTVAKVKGDMNYAHKTAPSLMVMSSDTFSNYRRYVPYGKYTGRGSGTHVMSRPTTKLQ